MKKIKRSEYERVTETGRLLVRHPFTKDYVGWHLYVAPNHLDGPDLSDRQAKELRISFEMYWVSHMHWMAVPATGLDYDIIDPRSIKTPQLLPPN